MTINRPSASRFIPAGAGNTLLGRIVTAVAHGSFFAIGATVVARLAPEGQASRAIALLFAGLTLAMVIGVPLGSLLGNGLGWRLPFYAVAILAAIGWLATAKAILLTRSLFLTERYVELTQQQ